MTDPLFDEQEDGSIRVLLPPDHPYCLALDVSIIDLSASGGWEVRWRDFTTVKQDRFFNTSDEAKKFARELMIGPHYGYLPDASSYITEYVEHTAFWSKVLDYARAKKWNT